MIDTRPQISYSESNLAREGCIPDAIRFAERVRCPRAVSQTAPGRLRVPDRPALRPAPAVRGRLVTGLSG
jgi:hypothetical protein